MKNVFLKGGAIKPTHFVSKGLFTFNLAKNAKFDMRFLLHAREAASPTFWR